MENYKEIIQWPSSLIVNENSEKWYKAQHIEAQHIEDIKKQKELYQCREEEEIQTAENNLLCSLWYEAYFNLNTKTYTVKPWDGFLKIMQWLLWPEITRNIKWEDLIAMTQVLDKAYQQQVWFKIQPWDYILFDNNQLVIKNSSHKILYSQTLGIDPSQITIINKSNKNLLKEFLYQHKPYTAVAESTKINTIYNAWRPMRQVEPYESISEAIDSWLMMISIWSMIFLAPEAAVMWVSICTVLTVASIGKAMLDTTYQYNKTWEIAKVRLITEIWSSVINKYTRGSWYKVVRLIWWVLDETSTPLWIRMEELLDH